MDQWNRAWTIPDPAVLRPLCDLARAKACASAVKDAAAYLTKGWRYDGIPGSTSMVHALNSQDGLQRVFARVQQHTRHVIDKQRQIHESYSEKRLSLIYFLSWTNSGWLLIDIRPVS
ncbi:hypothetical protein GCM10027053_41040 [Intrasporangium mesophilum]